MIDSTGGSGGDAGTTVLTESLSVTGGTILWGEEFNGLSGPPNPTIWTPELGYVRNDEKQYFTERARNLHLYNNNLLITATKESIAFQGFSYTSASISTAGRKSFKPPSYGRFEVRAKIPIAQGTWVAIWLLGSSYYQSGASLFDWPACGEIDIMEVVGIDPHTVYGTAHMAAGDRGGTYNFPGDISVGYHTYAVDWRANHLTWYFDGIPYFTYNNPNTGTAAWPFSDSRGLTFLITLSVGGSFGGSTVNLIYPKQLYIDYVRLYA